jgi:hypothetical protein
VVREEKLGLLGELAGTLGGDLRDVCVHDGEALPGASRGGAHGA